jgi:CRISPR/Cas system-associated exonuclease Cas4 (RecB family)
MKYYLSPSKINLLKDCPQCFWLQHNRKIKRPDGIFPSLPNGMDNTLKEHFDLFTKKGEMPPELANLKEYKLFPDLDKLQKWRSIYHGLVIENDKYRLKGAVDALLVKDDKIVVLDYKTRGYPLKADTHTHYIDQQTLYNYLLQKNGYMTEDYSYLLFYHPDKVVEKVFLFHSDIVKIDTTMKHAEELIQKALEVLDGPMPDSSDKCKYCKYRGTDIYDEKYIQDKKVGIKDIKLCKKTSLLDY